jgi:hypothetical protein
LRIKTKALATFTNLPNNRGKVVQYAAVIKDSKYSGSASPSDES